MAKKKTARRIAGTRADPTLPKTPVTIGGTTYFLCLDLGALAEAETAINREIFMAGSTEYVNLLAALPNPNVMNTRNVFAAAIRKFHPEISYAEAIRLVTLDNIFAIGIAIQEAWEAATPKKPADPPQPGA